jgi:ATP-dependent exoDNAse (exonuclease V) beta subunit
MRLPTGTVLAGTADLVARVPGGLALIDHKTFPGSPAAALARLPRYAGQLAAYADALEAATNLPVISLWIHLPVVGHMVEIRLLAAPRGAVVPLHVR